MRTITRIVRRGALVLGVLAGCAAQAQTCTPISGSATVTVTDLFTGSNYDAQGSITFSCTRPSGNPRFPATFWIGASGTNGSRNMASGGNTLGYQLFSNYSGCNTAWSGATGVTVNNSLTANGDTSLTNVTGYFCLRIATGGQNTVKPLTFSSLETLTIKSTNSTGFQWGTGTLSLSGTVNALCKFASPGTTTLSMNYTSFQGSDTVNNVPFNVQCTNTTGFSLALDATTGTVSALGLNYGIGLGAVGTQTIFSQSGTGNTQSYGVYGKVAAGQAGTCAAGAGCSGTDTRTITIAY